MSFAEKVFERLENTHHLMKTATEELLISRNLAREMVREKTHKVPNTTSKPPKQRAIPTPAEIKTDMILASQKKGAHAYISTAQKEKDDKEIAAKVCDQAMQVEPLYDQKSCIGYIKAGSTNYYCELCRSVCKSQKKENVFATNLNLHEHLYKKHGMYVCECRQWAHFWSKEGKRCHNECYQQHKKTSTVCQQFHKIRHTPSRQQHKRQYCLSPKNPLKIKITDEKHETFETTDFLPCMCENCLEE